MPYRKLPKTDDSRLRALQILLSRDDNYTVQHRVVELKEVAEAEHVYSKLLRAQQNYKSALAEQVRLSAKYQTSIKRTRMFISHFLQVLNMSMERGEIKEENKKFYGLKMGDFTLPDLFTEPQLIEWGRRVVDGERARLKEGGVPIYNPTVSKVAVQYDIFIEQNRRKNQQHDEVEQARVAVAQLRDEADKLLLEIWNQVEEKFAALPEEERYAKCRTYGVVYYYRRGEKHDLF